MSVETAGRFFSLASKYTQKPEFFKGYCFCTAIWCLLTCRMFSLFCICLCVIVTLPDSLTGFSLVISVSRL